MYTESTNYFQTACIYRDPVSPFAVVHNITLVYIYSTPCQKNMIFPQSSLHRSKKIRLCEHMTQNKFQVSSWSRTILNGSSKFWEFGEVVGFSRFWYNCSVQSYHSKNNYVITINKKTTWLLERIFQALQNLTKWEFLALFV